MLPGASLNTESSGEGEGAGEREINSTGTLFSGQKTRTSGYSKIRLRAKLVLTTRKPKKDVFVHFANFFREWNFSLPALHNVHQRCYATCNVSWRKQRSCIFSRCITFIQKALEQRRKELTEYLLREGLATYRNGRLSANSRGSTSSGKTHPSSVGEVCGFYTNLFDMIDYSKCKRRYLSCCHWWRWRSCF